jgi:2-polyprenyl-3-methyl-5-hydroxy-6-metoxy-1,4-benzoquinol methylase
MSNARKKAVDTTYLSLDTAEERGFIHRDYIAHCMRWSHVVREITVKRNYERAILLDVGCGRELPLAKLLYSSRLHPRQYVGVDYGPVEDAAMEVFHTGKFPLTVYERTDFCDLIPENFPDGQPNWVTCFEVLEHVEPEHMVRMLKHLKTLVTKDARLFFSTPCYNHQDLAANHVSEITYEALGAVFSALGFHVNGVWGTFASIRDYEQGLSTRGISPELFNSLRGYYDVNFLSCVFAPLFPAQSRNCLWELGLEPKHTRYTFQDLDACKTPWTSSENWETLREAVK